MKNDVTHLNSVAALSTIAAYEFRPLHSFSSVGSGGSQDAFSFGGTLRCRVSSPAFWLPPATHLHGLRAIDLAGGIAGHRHLFERKDGNSLSFGLSPAGGQIDAGRRQRPAGLAA